VQQAVHANSIAFVALFTAGVVPAKNEGRRKTDERNE
jgi:hypothetical protein